MTIPSFIKLTSSKNIIYINPEKISTIYPMTPVSDSANLYNACVIIRDQSYYVLETVEEILTLMAEKSIL